MDITDSLRSDLEHSLRLNREHREHLKVLTAMYEKYRDALHFATDELDQIVDGELGKEELRELLTFMRFAGMAEYSFEEVRRKYDDRKEMRRGPQMTDKGK